MRRYLFILLLFSLFFFSCSTSDIQEINNNVNGYCEYSYHVKGWGLFEYFDSNNCLFQGHSFDSWHLCLDPNKICIDPNFTMRIKKVAGDMELYVCNEGNCYTDSNIVEVNYVCKKN